MNVLKLWWINSSLFLRKMADMESFNKECYTKGGKFTISSVNVGS
jgi:hypothetical protein